MSGVQQSTEQIQENKGKGRHTMCEKGKVLPEVRTCPGMIKTTQKICQSCIYSIRFENSRYVCDYLAKARKSRGCPVGECDKYEKKKKGKRKEMEG